MYMFAETLGDLFRWYNSEEELIREHIESVFNYESGCIMIHDPISDEDIEKLLHPETKTIGYAIVRYISGDPSAVQYPQPLPPIIEYCIPFNVKAFKILRKYGILSTGASWHSGQYITIIDLTSVDDYKACRTEDMPQNAENFSLSDYSSTNTTIHFSVLGLPDEKRDYMLKDIKDTTGYDISVVGKLDCDIVKKINLVLEREPDWKTYIRHILTGRMGVIKIENDW